MLFLLKLALHQYPWVNDLCERDGDVNFAENANDWWTIKWGYVRLPRSAFRWSKSEKGWKYVND